MFSQYEALLAREQLEEKLRRNAERKQGGDSAWKRTLPTSDILITQQIEGVALEDNITTPLRSVDAGGSRISARSVYAAVHDGKIVPSAKPGGNFTDDKAVIGYTWQGLPFTIIVDGFFGSDKGGTFRLINDHVTPLMDVYAKRLSATTYNERNCQYEHKEIIKALMRQIKALKKTYARDSSFTMAIAITFATSDGQTYCASFSIGDCGLVLKKAKDGSIKQLVHSTTVNGCKEAFDDFERKEPDNFMAGFEGIIHRAPIDVSQVESEDEVLGYTYLTDLEEQQGEPVLFGFYRAPTDPKKGILIAPGTYRSPLYTEEYTVISYGLHCPDDFAKKDVPLFDQIVKINDEHYEKKCAEAKLATSQGQSEPERFGDDCAISSVMIPPDDVRRRLQILATSELPFTASAYNKSLYQETDEDLYTQADEELKRVLQEQKISSDLRAKISNVQLQVHTIKANGRTHDLPMLIKTLVKTTQVLTETESAAKIKSNADSYSAFGLQVRSARHSRTRQLLGAFMMVLGAALAAAGVLTILGTLGFGTVPGIAMAAGGGSLFLIGAGMFFKRPPRPHRELAAAIEDVSPLVNYRTLTNSGNSEF